MVKNEKKFAYIDGANLYRGMADFGWKLDYARFRVWLFDKYHVQKSILQIIKKPPRRMEPQRGLFHGNDCIIAKR